MLPKDRDVVASIQALRAIAVIFVVVNHLFPSHLPGGFIGVDIFFVVSGFLISSHLADWSRSPHGPTSICFNNQE